MASNGRGLNALRWIRAHIDRVSPVLPTQLAITVGRYAFKSLMGSRKFEGAGAPTLFRVVHRKELDLSNSVKLIYPENTVVLDTAFEPHYGFDIHTFLQGNAEYLEELDNRIFSYHDEVVLVGALSEGVSSGVLPTLDSILGKHGKDSVYLTVFPSTGHSSDALFNAFSSLGVLLLQGDDPVIILDRSRLDSFISVNRMGGRLSGEEVPRYLAEMFLDRKGMVKDLVKLSNSFKVELFTVLMASGSSLEIYENLRNILDVTLEQPLLDFDMKTISLVYVLVKAPLSLQESLTKGYIELEVNSWLKERLGINVPQICEPIYVDEFNDRVDVVILVGGFDSRPLFSAIDERLSRFDSLIMEHDFYDRSMWTNVKRRLLEGEDAVLEEAEPS